MLLLSLLSNMYIYIYMSTPFTAFHSDGIWPNLSKMMTENERPTDKPTNQPTKKQTKAKRTEWEKKCGMRKISCIFRLGQMTIFSFQFIALNFHLDKNGHFQMRNVPFIYGANALPYMHRWNSASHLYLCHSLCFSHPHMNRLNNNHIHSMSIPVHNHINLKVDYRTFFSFIFASSFSWFEKIKSVWNHRDKSNEKCVE